MIISVKEALVVSWQTLAGRDASAERTGMYSQRV